MVIPPSSWAAVIATHLVRSILENYWGNHLEDQISGLRVEIHRTRDLVASYNQVLSTCERDLKWAKHSSQWIININLFLGLLLLGLWLYFCFQRGSFRTGVRFEALRDQGGDLKVDKDSLGVVRRGPVRPSDLVSR